MRAQSGYVYEICSFQKLNTEDAEAQRTQSPTHHQVL
jgi:hypothetical protein